MVMSTTPVCRIALKEWAVAVKALDRGEQIMLLRKGGIREEGKDFVITERTKVCLQHLRSEVLGSLSTDRFISRWCSFII